VRYGAASRRVARLSHMPAPTPPRLPRWLQRAAPWLLVLALLLATGALVLRGGDDLALLRTLDLAATLALIAMQGLYLAIQSGRFHVVLVQLAERPVGFWPWLRLFVIGRFLNLFVPQAGNVYRGLELKRRFAISYTRFFAAFVNAPWLAMVLNFALGALAVAALHGDARVAAVPLWLALAAASLAAAAGPFLVAALLPLVPRRFAWAGWLHGRLREMLDVTLSSLREPGYLLRVLAWTLAAFVQAVAMLWLTFAALGASAGLGEAVAFYVLLQLTTYVAITPGNLGVQELAFAGLASGMGASAVDGVLVSGLTRVTGVVALVLLALPLGGLEALRAGRGDTTGAEPVAATADAAAPEPGRER